MGRAEVKVYLTYLAVNRKVAASTQNQALSALIFLYRDVLEKERGRKPYFMYKSREEGRKIN